MSFWAQDSFKGKDGHWGGDYVDLDTPFGCRDKVAHAVCGALLFAMVDRYFAALVAFGAVLVGGVLIEVWEWGRFAATKSFFSDRPSWRDLVANMAGAVGGWLLL